jgi:hypothetical protein
MGLSVGSHDKNLRFVSNWICPFPLPPFEFSQHAFHSSVPFTLSHCVITLGRYENEEGKKEERKWEGKEWKEKG